MRSKLVTSSRMICCGLVLALLIFGAVADTSTTSATRIVLPNFNSGSAHVVLSQLYRCKPRTSPNDPCVPYDQTLPSERQERDEKRFQFMQNLNLAGVKYGREVLNWNQLTNSSPSPGECLTAEQYATDTLWVEFDAVINAYAYAGIEPVVQIIGTPYKCSHGADEAISNREKTRYPPIGCKAGEVLGKGVRGENCQYLKDFLNAAVARYKDRVHYWEIWNEPDQFREVASGIEDIKNHVWFKGTHQDYARLLRVSYKRIKAVDPSATVLIGGMTQGIATDGTLERQYFLDLIAHINNQEEPTFGKIFDKFNFHDYSASTTSHLQNIRATLNQYGFSDRPIWITELGRWANPRLTRQELATVMYNQMTTLPAAGAERVFWFMASDMCLDHNMDPNDLLSTHGLLDCSINPTPYLHPTYKQLFFWTEN